MHGLLIWGAGGRGRKCLPAHRCWALQMHLARGPTSVTRKFMMRLFMSSLRTVTAAKRLFQSSAEIFRFCSQALE